MTETMYYYKNNVLLKAKKESLFLISKKAPFDLIIGQIIKELLELGINYLTQLFNAILKASYFPLQWKVVAMVQIIMIPKPNKDSVEIIQIIQMVIQINLSLLSII
jgi:hypothetical protein